MTFTKSAFTIFEQAIQDYHLKDAIDTPINNPYAEDSIENILYKKNWIDTVQWHLEDEIRRPEIEPSEGMKFKRRIDKSNQDRTDLVEDLDTWFYNKYSTVTISDTASFNTESPAWAFDRLSILALKIYHMNAEATDDKKSAEHRANCQTKVDVLLTQKADLIQAIEELLHQFEAGEKYMKVYKQMKMYNDPNLNPALQKK